MGSRKDELLEEVEAERQVVSALVKEREELLLQATVTEEVLRADLNVVKVHNAEIQANLDQQIALVSTLKLRLRTLQEQAEDLEHKLVHETASLERCQTELATATAAVAQSQGASEAKVAALLESIAQSQRMQDIMVAQLSEKNDCIASLEDKSLSLADSLRVQTARMSELETELASLRAEMAGAVDLAEERLRDSTNKLESLRSDQLAQERYIAEVEAQRKAFKADLSVKVAEIGRLEQQLEKLVEESKEQTAHVTKLRLQLSAAQARLEEEGHKRIRQLAAHEQKLSELEVAQVASDHALHHYEAKVATLTAELAAITANGSKPERMSI